MKFKIESFIHSKSHFGGNVKNLKHSKPCQDHLGNTFESIQAMCDYWGINRRTFDSRTKISKVDIKTALTLPVNGRKLQPTVKNSRNSKPCQDHLGNTFESIQAMCDYWGINRRTFDSRIRTGLCLESALTLPV